MGKIAKDKPAVAAKAKEKLPADLERYRKLGIDLGAEDARIVPASDVIQSMRSRMACFFPRCRWQGASQFCPPSWGTPWEYAKAIRDSYKYAIILRLSYPPEYFNSWTAPIAGRFSGLIDFYKRDWSAEDVEYWRDVVATRPAPLPPGVVAGIADAIVLEARKDGHQFAFTGMSGSCAGTLCGKFGATCPALTTGLCRNPGRARPDGAQAMYADYPRISARQGWQDWLAGWSIWPEDYPSGPLTPNLSRTSIVFID